MRKKKNRRKKYFPLILVITVLLLFMFFGVGYSLLQEELTINGKGTINVKQNTPGLPEGKDFDVTFHDNGGWGDTYNYAISLKNLTTTASKGWIIYILVPSDTTILSNSGCDAKIENGMLILTNASHNGEVGGSGSASWIAYFKISTSDSSVMPFKYTALKR